MPILRVTKNFEFEAAHALTGYKGKCAHLHGHGYKLSVCVRGEAGTDGMVIDFKLLKQIVNEQVIDIYDHALIVSESAIDSFDMRSELFSNVIRCKFVPTSENLLIEFAHKISKSLPEKVELFSLTLSETQGNSAQWFAQDNI